MVAETRGAQAIGAIVAAVLAASLVACAPATDHDRYQTGVVGTSTLRNELASTTLYLGGCGHFDYEKLVGSEWVSQGPDFLCVWEGFAQPVAPGQVVTDSFVARDPGVWRLRYAVGLGCSASAPLSQCPIVRDLVSNEFTVLGPGGGCVVTGCSSQLCAEHEVATTCEWRPEYACYRDAVCGRFGPADECAWLPTEELGRCLAADGGNLTPR